MLFLYEKKGGLIVISEKELMHLEDFLNMEQTYVKTLNYFSNSIQDNQTKQLFQQMASKNQQNFDVISKHLNAGKSLQ